MTTSLTWLEPYSRESFERLVRDASVNFHEQDVVAFDGAQVDYIARHVGEDNGLGARWMLVERQHQDRYYTDEFASYYARCLRPPPSAVTRIHFLGLAWLDPDQAEDEALALVLRGSVDRELSTLLSLVASKNLSAAFEAHTQRSYLGYTCIRPIPSVPVGRTILSPLMDADAASRGIRAVREHRVHLLGMRLGVEGLAFQQQDVAVAACATTALWSALQAVRWRDGHRPPTPSALTEAAGRHFIPFGRAFPASMGLTLEQMCGALREAGADPVVFDCEDGKEFTKSCFLLQVYLRSGIPVILGIQSQHGGHAVTALGCRDGGNTDLTLNGESLTLQGGKIDRLYLHDDRLGPYARAEIELVAIPDPRLPNWDSCPKGDSTSLPAVGIPFDVHNYTEWSHLLYGIVPHYPKLRLTAEDLLLALSELIPFINKVSAQTGKKSSVDARFIRSGDLFEWLLRTDVRSESLARLMVSLRPSRYVGVLSLYLDEHPAMHWLLDTTDILREPFATERLLGIVSAHRACDSIVDAYAGVHKVHSG